MRRWDCDEVVGTVGTPPGSGARLPGFVFWLHHLVLLSLSLTTYKRLITDLLML